MKVRFLEKTVHKSINRLINAYDAILCQTHFLHSALQLHRRDTGEEPTLAVKRRILEAEIQRRVTAWRASGGHVWLPAPLRVCRGLDEQDVRNKHSIYHDPIRMERDFTWMTDDAETNDRLMQGPTWANHSCGWDTLAMTLLAVDAGLIHFDQTCPTLYEANSLTADFLSFVATPWGRKGRGPNRLVERGQLMQESVAKIIANHSQKLFGKPPGSWAAIIDILNVVIADIPQFRLLLDRERVCEGCELISTVADDTPTKAARFTERYVCITIGSFSDRLMEEVRCQTGCPKTSVEGNIAAFFGRNEHRQGVACHRLGCYGTRYQYFVSNGDLPPRLVVDVNRPGQNVKHFIEEHCGLGEFNFEYYRRDISNGRKVERVRTCYRTAVVGIFLNGNHFNMWFRRPGGSWYEYDGMRRGGRVAGPYDLTGLRGASTDMKSAFLILENVACFPDPVLAERRAS